MRVLILATRNPHKTREFAQILGGEAAVRDLADLADVPAVEETGCTFEENATLKAVAVSAVVPGLVVADDSGLEVAGLGGAPGVFSARYAGANASDAENVARLLMELSRLPAAGRSRAARFCCALAVAQGGRLIKIVRGDLDGIIAATAIGKGGFGYDPIFVPAGLSGTFAELGVAEKNRISHRAKAIARLRDFLQTLA